MTEIILSRRAALGGGVAAFAAATTPAWSKPGGDPDVLILGAGMAGLHAARLIEQSGASVQVLEGSGRIGGRCWTKRDIQGRPELGAMQVGADYGRVRGNATDLGVELVDPPKGASSETSLPPLAVSVRGAPPTGDWADSPMNRLPPGERKLSPLALNGFYVLKNDPLGDLEDWRDPKFGAIDRMSLRGYLAKQGASPEALRLIGVTAVGASLDEMNALDTLRKSHYYAFSAKTGPAQYVRDGTDALTGAMAASLKRKVHLGKVVAHIDAGPKGVAITCRDGSVHRARAAISTIPPAVFRDIPVTGAMPAKQRAVWNRFGMAGLVQVFLTVRTPFWEKDRLAPTMWTDGPAEIFIHAPSHSDPLGIYYAYINGAGATRAAVMSDAALRAMVLDELFKRRPAARGAVEAGYVHRWATYPFSKGHIAYHRPGDIGTYGDAAEQPVGALYFAGEHLGRVAAGIEAACESAENATVALLEAIGS